MDQNNNPKQDELSDSGGLIDRNFLHFAIGFLLIIISSVMLIVSINLFRGSANANTECVNCEEN